MNNSAIDISTLVTQLNLNLKDVDFNFIMIMIIFPIGVTLNILQLYVFSKKQLNLKTNMGSMHALLSLFNVIALVNSIFIRQLLPIFKINLKEYTNFGCKLMNFIQRFSLDLPSFQQVLISFMFFMSIKFPMKFIALQNSKKQYLFIILSMIIFAFAENIGYFFFELKLTYSNLTSINETDNATQLSYEYLCYSSFYLTLGTGILDVIFRNFMPFILMFIFNILIVFHIYKNHLKLHKTYKARGHKHFFISIMTINLIFFILYLPWSIAQVIVLVQYFFTARIAADIISPSSMFFFNIGWWVSYLNYICPFFVYIRFNRLFRKELFSLVNYDSREKSSSFVPQNANKSGTTTKVGPQQTIRKISMISDISIKKTFAYN